LVGLRHTGWDREITDQGGADSPAAESAKNALWITSTERPACGSLVTWRLSRRGRILNGPGQAG